MKTGVIVEPNWDSYTEDLDLDISVEEWEEMDEEEQSEYLLEMLTPPEWIVEKVKVLR